MPRRKRWSFKTAHREFTGPYLETSLEGDLAAKQIAQIGVHNEQGGLERG